MQSKNTFAVFLTAVFILLSGAETEGVGRTGGTLPLRGDGTLPLRMPSEGTLPLIMTGVAAIPQASTTNQTSPDVVMSMDVEMAHTDPSAAADSSATNCSDVFGPIWVNISGSGLMIVGSEEMAVSEVCMNKLTEDISLIVASKDEQAINHCFVTGLKTVEDLSLVSGHITCTETVSGSKDFKFSLLSQG